MTATSRCYAAYRYSDGRAVADEVSLGLDAAILEGNVYFGSECDTGMQAGDSCLLTE